MLLAVLVVVHCHLLWLNDFGFVLQEYDAHHGKQKNLLNIDIRFADNPRRGGGGNVGRGGRGSGGGRGGRGRGAGPDSYRGGGFRDDRPRARSSGSHRERAPNVADEMDFPSLDKTLDSARAWALGLLSASTVDGWRKYRI